MDKAQFEAILGRYNLPKEAHWERLLEGLLGRKMIRDIYFNTDECLQPWAQDSEELIHLIRAVGKGGEIKVQPASGGAVTIQDKALQKYLLLSLHKLLYLRWQLDTEPTEEEKKEGCKWILINGYKEPVKVPFKNLLQDEEGGFIQPFSEEELDTLLEASCWIKEAKNRAKGRGNKNFAALGDAVIGIKADCHPEALKMGKTDLLNFIADIMYLEGFFEGVQDAQVLSEELEKRLNNPARFKAGEVRKKRQQMLTDWVKAAKKVKLDTTYRNCSKCEDFEGCQISKNLQQYDI